MKMQEPSIFVPIFNAFILGLGIAMCVWLAIEAAQAGSAALATLWGLLAMFNIVRQVPLAIKLFVMRQELVEQIRHNNWLENELAKDLEAKREENRLEEEAKSNGQK